MRQTYTITTTAAVASALTCTRSCVNIYWNKLQIFLTLATLTNSNNNITVFQLCKYLLHRLYGYEKQNMYTQRSGGWRRGSALGHPLHAMLHWRKKKKNILKKVTFFIILHLNASLTSDFSCPWWPRGLELVFIFDIKISIWKRLTSNVVSVWLQANCYQILTHDVK